MPAVLKQLLSSKKFLILAAGIAVTLLVTKLGWDEATANKVVGLFAMYLGSQGLADFGKGKAQAEGDAGTADAGARALDLVTGLLASEADTKDEPPA